MRIVIAVVAITDAEGAVGILIVQIVWAGLIHIRIGLIVLAIPRDVVDTHCGVRHIEHLELAILVAGIENKLAVVAPLKPVQGGDGGGQATALLALLVVLHHHSVNLLIGVGNRQAAVVKTHGYLLVTLVRVYIGIGGGAHAELHVLLGNHKLGHQHLAVVIVLIKHMQAVVAAHLKAAAVVGQLQLVVGVGDDGVAGVLVIVDGVAVEALEPVALKHTL